MVPAARWLVVALTAVTAVAVPALVRAWPVSQPAVDTWTLARAVAAADAIPWSGEVRSVGALDLPLTGSDFGGLARLVGGSNDLRVWWGGKDDWRVDRLRATGETDTLRDGGLAVKWSYEDNTARFTAWSTIRLPDDLDVLPPSLGARLFEGVRRSEVSPLPARRIAGRAAAGLRLVPADARTSIARADVWADPATGLPLRVEVYDDTLPRAVLVSEATSVHLGPPPVDATSFRIASGAAFVQGTTLDDAAAANAFAPFLLPDRVDGLVRRGSEIAQGAVGFYGRGPVSLGAIPLRDQIANELGRQISKSAASQVDGPRTSLQVGPVSVLLVQSPRANFLLLGTVTPATLVSASQDLLRGVRRTR